MEIPNNILEKFGITKAGEKVIKIKKLRKKLRISNIKKKEEAMFTDHGKRRWYERFPKLDFKTIYIDIRSRMSRVYCVYGDAYCIKGANCYYVINRAGKIITMTNSRPQGFTGMCANSEQMVKFRKVINSK